MTDSLARRADGIQRDVSKTSKPPTKTVPAPEPDATMGPRPIVIPAWGVTLAALVTAGGIGASYQRSVSAEERLVKRMDDMGAAIDRRFAEVHTTLDRRVGEVGARIDRVDARIDRMESRVLDLERRAGRAEDRPGAVVVDAGASVAPPSPPAVVRAVAALRARSPRIGVERTWSRGQWGLWVQLPGGALVRGLLTGETWAWTDADGAPVVDPTAP